MRNREIDNSMDVIDSRDVVERLEELEGEFEVWREEREGDIADLEQEIEDSKNGENPEEAIETLRKQIEELKDTPDEEFEAWEELVALRALKEEGEGATSEWADGAMLIRDSYFTDYAEELCKDIGDIPRELPWYIANHIDWDGVADELKADYSSIDFNGVEYWVRS